jgi:hypothetical protein
VGTRTDVLGESLRRVVGEALGDVNQDVTPEKHLIDWTEQTWSSPTSVSGRAVYELNRFYVARLSDYTPPGSYPSTVRKPYLQDVNAYWTDDGVTIPSGYYNFLAIYSRASLLYPLVSAYARLPDLTRYPAGTSAYIGLEEGGASRTGAAFFLFMMTSAGVKLYAVYGSRAWVNADVTARLPSDYATTYHDYYVKVNEWGAEFYVDNRLAAVAIDAPGAPQRAVASAPPYAVAVTDAPVSRRFHALLELGFPYPTSTNIRPNPGAMTLTVRPLFFRWCSDAPNPPRTRQLYVLNTDTTLAGYSISSGSATSHPVPVSGYSNKTLYFMADQAGTLNIEIYTLTGNWRTYDSVSVSANTLVKYRITDPAVLARVTFTPSTYPTKVLEAEASLH